MIKEKKGVGTSLPFFRRVGAELNDYDLDYETKLRRESSWTIHNDMFFNQLDHQNDQIVLFASLFVRDEIKILKRLGANIIEISMSHFKKILDICKCSNLVLVLYNAQIWLLYIYIV